MKKRTIDETINDLSKIAVELSLKIVEKMTEAKEIEPDEIKHLNEIKKHLSFAKKVRKEMTILTDGCVKPTKVNALAEMRDKIKSLQSTVGDIVRTMPKN